jgi:alpha-2-macroglobulin
MTPIPAMAALMRRAGRSLLSNLSTTAHKFIRFAGMAVRLCADASARLAVAVFGRWEWRPPAWASWTGTHAARGRRHLAAHPRQTALAIGIVIVAAAGYLWYSTRPQPYRVTYTVHSPALTTYDEKDVARIDAMTIHFSDSAATLERVEKEVLAGLEISPAIAGKWLWTTDQELRFMPDSDWPVDEEFSVRIARRGLLAGHIQLDDYRFTFKTAPFSARFTDRQFYQDPVNPALKKLVATVAFSHSVDAAQFESLVSLTTAKDAAYLGLTVDSRHFTVSYDKLKLSAFIHSAALSMPADDTPITVNIDKGVRAARGGNATADRLAAIVIVPGRTSLRFSSGGMTIVDNARYEPEQVLLLESSSPVSDRALAGKITMQLLPERHPRQSELDRQPYRWTNLSEIGADILAGSSPLPLTYVPSDEGGNTSHGFKFLAPVDRYVYVQVKDGVAGTGGYISGKPFVATVKVEPYHQALTFLGQGALLSLTGDRQVGFLVRDVDEVEIEIGRVLPNQLHHLAPHMFEFARPSTYGEVENQLVERFSVTRDYRGRPPGKPIYDSVDLGQYLEANAGSPRGLFLLRVRSTDNSRGDSVVDTRLVLVTDLGVIVKRAKDGSRDVFVQSIRTGLPVSGARIAMIGVNGQPALEATTGAGGRARLPKTDLLLREKRPLLILAHTDSDLSFVPLGSHDRRLDMSRFDIGGIENQESPQQLSSYLFSDRGIYRPGETVHLGVITRTADWKGSLTGLPLDVEISDSRGLVVSKTQLKLSAASFDEVAFTTQAASPTGTYQAVAYVTMNTQSHRTMLGSASFRVQEFEPDRMKVQLELSEKPIAGWLKTDEVKARITAAHLFGEPAGNRRVEAEMTLTPALPRFARHTDYRFQISQGLNEPYQQTLAGAVTDEAGAALINLDLRRFVGRAYYLSLLGRAFEAEGGRSVAAQSSAIVSDAPFLVGVKADGDLSFVPRGSVRGSQWLAVDSQLTPVAVGGLTLDWVQRRYVSVLTRQNNGTYRYVSQLREVVRDSRAVRVTVAGTRLPLPTAEPGDFVLVLRDSAGAELNKLFYSVAGQANLTRSLERNTELQVQLDKPSYGGGDTIAVSVRAPYVGAGLITIERERVLHFEWFKATTTSSVHRITLPADFEGNGYVSVQFLRDPASPELFMSPLSYGVAPFAADLGARTQAVKLDAPSQVKPGATLIMKLTAAEPSRVAVLTIDEGILQVARYRNPDPLGFFFQKRMLEVETKQILDLILPEFKRFAALAAPGGDAEAGLSRHLNPFGRKRKPPVAYWSGVIDVRAGVTELRYEVPDYFNGRLRIVAVGVSPDRIGVAQAYAEVKGDFILTPNVPVMVAPGDEFIVSVGVFNNSTGTGGVVRLDAQTTPGVSLVGPASIDLEIAEKKEGVGQFRFKANDVLGPAMFTFTARRGVLASRIEESVSVRPPIAFRTQLTLGRMTGSSQNAPLTRDLYRERRTVEAAVSNVPLVWGQGLTAYLDNYPYSCTEQLVSRGMSALILATRPEFGRVKGGAPQQLEFTFSMLRGRANDSGGFGLWTSSPQTAEFATVYAAHFLVEAKDRGQKVPPEIVASVNDWLTRFASTPASSLPDGRMRAYAVYLLARQGIRPNAALANVEQELTNRYPKDWPSDLAAAYLASTYRLMQRTADAERIVRDVPWSPDKAAIGEDIYYDAVVHDAQLLYLLAAHFPTRVNTVPPVALETLSAAISGNRTSSLSAAYTMLALDAFSKAATAADTLGIARIGTDGRDTAFTLPLGAMPKVSVPEATSALRFASRGPLTAYFVINESGFDHKPPVKPIADGLEIFREFLDTAGRPVTQVTVGQEFLVRLRVRATRRDREPQIAIVDLLPGGVEPVLDHQPSSLSDWRPEHVDMRDDRVIVYGDATNNIGGFVYRVRATNAGSFQSPPAFAEGMYNRTIVALSVAGRLEIVKP